MLPPHYEETYDEAHGQAKLVLVRPETQREASSLEKYCNPRRASLSPSQNAPRRTASPRLHTKTQEQGYANRRDKRANHCELSSIALTLLATNS
jgi:hypothetical protein